MFQFLKLIHIQEVGGITSQITFTFCAPSEDL